MSLPEGFLDPISAEKPSGEPLRYTPLYDQINEARRQELPTAQGVWQKEVKVADFRAVEKLAGDALKKKSKDLQLAVWLTESWIRRNGFGGLEDGLELIHGLLTTFWDTLYPEAEDGDLELRAAPLEWLGNYFDPSRGSSPCLALIEAPLNNAGHGFLQYQQSRQVPGKEEASQSSDASKKREAALADGKLSPEEFDVSFQETPKAFYKELTRSLAASQELLKGLDDICSEKFGREAPSFHRLANSLEEIGNLARILLARKLEADPDPVEMPEPSPEELAAQAASGELPPGESYESPAGLPMDDASIQGLQPRNRDEAILRILAAAHYLRKSDPQNPSSYLILRSLRWGEILKANGEPPDPNLLIAPPTATRIQLRRLAAANRWAELLEAAEQAMGTECGRGWLDLQRYSVKACESLGYARAAAMILSALKRLLSESPNLPSATMTDDTGTANPETLTWLSGLN